MQNQNAPEDTVAAERLVEPVGRAQTPMASHIDADVQAIRDLKERIEHLWGNLAVPSREDLSARLDLLGTAADHRATDSRPVRKALQEVLLSVGTGAVATLSESTRQRLAALTGIALPGHLPSAGSPAAEDLRDVRAGNEQANPGKQSGDGTPIPHSRPGVVEEGRTPWSTGESF